MKVKKTLESNIPRRFAQVNNMPEGEIYSFFFECYLAYMEMFRERMKFGRILNQIISEYKDIDEFKKSTPRRIYSELLRLKLCRTGLWLFLAPPKQSTDEANVRPRAIFCTIWHI